MKNKASRRAVPRGRIQPRRAGLSLRRTEISRSGSRMTESHTDAYGYNDRNELTNAVRNATLNEYAYQYDDIGNRLSSLDLGTNRTYTANALNQYTQISNLAASCDLASQGSSLRSSGDPTPLARAHLDSASLREEFIPTFDLDGNQTLIQTATGVWQVSYNGENRPVLWTCGSTNITMKYDRMGRRVEYLETVTGVTNAHHRFVYDGYLCIQRLNAASNNAIDLVFGWDPSEPVATRPLVLQKYGQYNLFYTHDGNKNVSELVFFQQSNGIAAHYEYAPFGAVTAATTNTAFTAFNVAEANPFRFSSEYADDTLGLVYYNYRHYNPCVGRWLNRDPIEEEGGENLYTFCGNNPVLYVDVNGEFFLVDTLVMGALGGVIGGVSAALTGGDIGAGIAGGFISGACISICPAAAAECGAAGGAVAGFISGVRGANKAKLCGAKWHLHVAGSVVIGTVLGKYSGKLSSRLSDGLSQAAGGILTSTTTRTSSFSVSLSVVGPDIATSISCGVTSTAVEMVFLTTPEAAKKAIDEIGNGYNKTIERIDMEFEASGQFK